MLLEKADFIEDKIWDLQKKVVSQKRELIISILLGAVITLSLLGSLDIVSFLIIVLGLVISIYTRSKENGGKLKSPFCINKGIFSCDKTKAYKILGLPFYDISIIYFLGGLLSISYFGLSLCFFNSFVSWGFILYILFVCSDFQRKENLPFVHDDFFLLHDMYV